MHFINKWQCFNPSADLFFFICKEYFRENLNYEVLLYCIAEFTRLK